MSSIAHRPQFDQYYAYTYVQLTDQSSPDNIRTKLEGLVSAYSPGIISEGLKIHPDLQSLKSIHLYSSLEDEIKEGENGQFIRFLLLIALLVLFIAWINYANLAASRAHFRSKEAGIRKVVGASRLQLVFNI
ncbi:MAG: hypothetical protein OEW75_16105, partial [Cyclobacteriaceae bacterium]|nr:hypothetical protein [Cyclobacteriaceae bacterium]